MVSLLARSTKSKSGRNNLKHTGLALCVDKQWGIPLFHSLYRANSHDSKTFHNLIDELINVVKTDLSLDNMILVIDKGNNSKENFELLKGKIEWIGSLKLSDYEYLYKIDLKDYKGQYNNYKYYETVSEIMGIKMKLVLTYNSKLERKQLASLNAGIIKLKKKIEKKCSEYKRKPKKIPKAVENMLSKSFYGKYLKVSCQEGKPIFEENQEIIDKKKNLFGKTLLFSSNVNQNSCEIISLYHSKNKIENGIKLLKDPHLISWQPMRHWTDSKIRAFAFSNIMALVIIRMMQYKAAKNNIKMSVQVLKQELKDLKEVSLIYDEKTAQIKITEKSTIQNRLWKIYNLGKLEK